jgi:SAM-dependent methyltransferase
MMKALVLYWSRSGNTEKVAAGIRAGLTAAGCTVDYVRIEGAPDLDFFDYDLVCLGFPSYNWHPPKAVDEFLRARFARYRKEGRVLPGAPVIPGRHALVFCTYSGPHTGIREAIPAGKYAGQFFEHLGFAIADEWYVLAEFHGDEELSTAGRMGTIKGLPSEQDLARIEEQASLLARRLT